MKIKYLYALVAIVIVAAIITILTSLPTKEATRDRVQSHLGSNHKTHEHNQANKIPTPVGFMRPKKSIFQTKYSYVGNKVGRAGDIPMLMQDGKLSRLIISELGLTNDESISVQKHIDAFSEGMSKVITDNMKEDLLRSDSKIGMKAYSIQPFENQAMNEFQKLIDNLNSSLGEASQKSLLEHYDVSSRFFGMGFYEASLKVYPGKKLLLGHGAEDNIASPYRVVYELHDPTTMRVACSAESDMDSFMGVHGKILEVEK